jgi:hypothetical protein
MLIYSNRKKIENFDERAKNEADKPRYLANYLKTN